MLESITVYLDTNFFLHYQMFDQIAWKEEVQASIVWLRLAPVVVEEIDKHKEFHSLKHMRERARKVASRLVKAVQAGGHLGSDVHLVFDLTQAASDPATRGLDPARPDDRLLSSILDYKDAHPDELVAFVTSDSSLALRAFTLGVKVIPLDDRFRIKSQPDERDTLIQDLKSQIHAGQQQIPKLSLTFVAGNKEMEIELPPDPVLPIEEARAWVAQHIVPNHPLRNVDSLRALQQKNDDPNFHESAVAISQFVGMIGETMFSMGNEKLLRYFEEYAQFCVRNTQYHAEIARTFLLPLYLCNDGTIPAEDVNLTITVHGQVQIFPYGVLPPPPLPPMAPGSSASPLAPNTAPRTPEHNAARLIQARPNTGTVELRYHLARLNHHVPESVPGLYLRFPRSFALPVKLEYRVAAVNAAHLFQGELCVVPKSFPPPNRPRIPRKRRVPPPS